MVDYKTVSDRGNASLLNGLPDDVGGLLASPPLTEKSLLELAVQWDRLPHAQAKMADALRLFVVTWDPIEWRVPRPEAIATANARPTEIVVYVPVWSATSMAERHETTLAGVFAELTGAAVITAAENDGAITFGGYATLVRQGKVPDLLSARGTDAVARLGQPVITAVSPEWEPLGLGAITDFVQHVYGNVNFDRSLVTLSSRAVNSSCPACRGASFRFPADLGDSTEYMCPAHRAEAQGVITSRLAQAELSNRQGWRVIGEASIRSTEPHLPGGLATRLAATGLNDRGRPETDALVARARLVIEATTWFEGKPGEFARALRRGRDRSPEPPAWLTALIRHLGRAGKMDEAVELSEALSAVDPIGRRRFQAQLEIARSEAEFAKVKKPSAVSERSSAERPDGAAQPQQRRQPRAKASKARRTGTR